MKQRLLIAALALAIISPALAEGGDEVAQWRSIGIGKSFGKHWSLDGELEYRACNNYRFSAGLGVGYKVNKYLKLGAGYNFILNPREKSERTNDKSEFPAYDPARNEADSPDRYPNEWYEQQCPDEFTNGYNYYQAYHLPPRHRAYFSVTGDVKLWGWLKISLRERVQWTWRKSYSTPKLTHREKYVKQYDFDFDEDWNIVDQWSVVQEDVSDVWSTKEYEATTDKVLRSRIKLEIDKKKSHLVPFISAEAHNSISAGDDMLLQKLRTAAGVTYRFKKHHEVTLAYVLSFDMYDTDNGERVYEGDRLHAISMGYNYSF